MTQIAVLYRPCKDAIVTGTAILPVHDLHHIDIAGARLELEAEIGMAYFAGETDAVEPVRKYHWPDILCVRVVIDYYIAVFGQGEAIEIKSTCQDECVYDKNTGAAITSGYKRHFVSDPCPD
jgi:hypothetical protein